MGKLVRMLAVVALFFLILWGDRLGTAPRIVLAIAVFSVIMMFGTKMLGGFSQPMAEPPPPGELRKVRLDYRCDICGSEARMTSAPDEDPPAPKHCLEDMILVTPVE